MITDLGAVDTDLGVLKTGKEADVHLLERATPGSSRERCSPRSGTGRASTGCSTGTPGTSRAGASAAPRDPRDGEPDGVRPRHHRRASGPARSSPRSPGCGSSGATPVPYPVQLLGTELLLEFVGEADGTAAPRLAQVRPDAGELRAYWRQTVDALTVLARAGLAHGDLSPYNVLVHARRLVLIDLPQVVDVVANPQGPAFLARDVRTMTAWFARARAGPGRRGRATALTARLLADAGLSLGPMSVAVRRRPLAAAAPADAGLEELVDLAVEDGAAGCRSRTRSAGP